MHILFLTHYFPPEVNAPASRTFECAKVWAARGHKVTIVTPAPSHPGGIVYPGYRNRWTSREQVDGIDVIRIWTFVAANKGFAKRTLGFLSYPLSLLLHMWRLPKADIVVSSSPQFFAGLGGRLLKRRHRPWVLEIRDLYPESIVAVGAMKRGLGIRLLEKLERGAYRSADGIVSVTDSFVPHIAERRGRDDIAVIKNGVDLSFFTADGAGEAAKLLRRSLGLEGKFVAAYVGTHGAAHGLDTILDAADLLRGDDRFAFLLVGDGSERERLAAAVRARGLENVLLLGQRPKADMPVIWAAADVGLVLLKRSDTFKAVLPSKMFEIMGMARPIILGVEGEAAALLENAGAGVAITPESAAELAGRVSELADDPERVRRLGEAGRRYVAEQFDRTRLAERYADFLLETVRRRRRG